MGFREEFAEPYDRLDEAGAAVVLREVWGLEDARLDRLDTERDDTFRVRSPHGDFVLKVAHPADDPLYVNLQTAAMGHAAELEPLVPLQRLVLSRTGEVEPEHDGRVARLLTWLPGVPLFAHAPQADDLFELGVALGRLNSALASFDHPAAHRDFVWDAARLDLVEELRPLVPAPEIGAAFALVSAHAELVDGLPRQVIHNDFHPGNVLVASPFRVTGVLDFGDVIHTARAVDVAVALSYLRTPLGIADASPFVAGFETIVRLTAEEHAALPVLVAARLTQRILVNAALHRGDPAGRADAIGGAASTLAALAALLEEIA